MTPTVHSSDTRHHNTPRIPAFLAALFVLTSLVTTGCDVVDSNSPVYDEAVSYDETVALRARHAPNDSPRWITPLDEPESFSYATEIEGTTNEDRAVSRLVGVWQLATADVQTLAEGSLRPVITFRADRIFTGYTECSNFSGRFAAGSDGHLTITTFRSTSKFCYDANDPVRDTFFGGLQSATDFRFEHGTLWITSRGGKRERVLIFERMDGSADGIGMLPAANQ